MNNLYLVWTARIILVDVSPMHRELAGDRYLQLLVQSYLIDYSQHRAEQSLDVFHHALSGIGITD